MRFLSKEVKLKDGAKCILRSPDEKDAEKMIEYLRITSGETYFMIRYPEEITLSVEQEKKILKNTIQSDKDIMVAAFIDGELAGNAGLGCFMNLKKVNHRAEFGISIKQKFWNKGIGNILISEIIKEAKKIGYDQIELGVFSDNKKAQAIYKKHGFKEWGNIQNAYKLSDGTYRDEIVMGRIL